MLQTRDTEILQAKADSGDKDQDIKSEIADADKQFSPNYLLHGDNIVEIIEASSTGFISNARTIIQPIVSHTTDHIDKVRAILKNGIQLESSRGNTYGNKAFYVAEGGFSIHEVDGKYTIAFSLSSQTKIYDAIFRRWCRRWQDLLRQLRKVF